MGRLNQPPPLVQFDENFIENICYSISYSMNFNEKVLENNIACVFAKIYISDGIRQCFLHAPPKSRGGLIQPPTPTNIYTRFLFRDLYKILLHIKRWQTSENFSFVPPIVFFLRCEKPKLWNFLELPKFKNVFFKTRSIWPQGAMIVLQSFSNDQKLSEDWFW